MKKGFTIIETVIYIALLSLLLTGAFTSAYSIIQSAQNLQEKNTVYGEANFVIQKLRWVLMNIQNITTPSKGSPNTSSATIVHHDGTVVVIRKIGSAIEMSQSGPSGPFYPLTTQNVEVSDLRFTRLDETPGSPTGIMATAIINGISFSVTKYTRQ